MTGRAPAPESSPVQNNPNAPTALRGSDSRGPSARRGGTPESRPEPPPAQTGGFQGRSTSGRSRAPESSPAPIGLPPRAVRNAPPGSIGPNDQNGRKGRQDRSVRRSLLSKGPGDSPPGRTGRRELPGRDLNDSERRADRERIAQAALPPAPKGAILERSTTGRFPGRKSSPTPHDPNPRNVPIGPVPSGPNGRSGLKDRTGWSVRRGVLSESPEDFPPGRSDRSDPAGRATNARSVPRFGKVAKRGVPKGPGDRPPTDVGPPAPEPPLSGRKAGRSEQDGPRLKAAG